MVLHTLQQVQELELREVLLRVWPPVYLRHARQEDRLDQTSGLRQPSLLLHAAAYLHAVPYPPVPQDAFYLREEREEYVPEEEWDPDAWDAVPPTKWVQKEADVPRAAERSPPGEIFGVKLHPNTMLVEVEEIRGNLNLSPTLRMGPDTNASVNGKIKQVLQENWTGTPAANSKIFTTSIGMERLREKFPRAR
eukprot:g19956.t1